MAHKRCFVIAPIGERGSPARRRSDKILERLIRPAAAQCGYIAVRADELGQPGLISRQVVRRIVTDPLVIADLTGHNPNVFYELALRHATGKPLVQLIEHEESIPFDVADMHTVRVNHRSGRSMERAQLEIVSQIRELEATRTRFETPVLGETHPLGAGGRGRPLRDWAPCGPDKAGLVEGKRLFQHSGYYPISLAPGTNVPSLNRQIFLKAVHYFLRDDCYDRLAAMDLVYLREDNIDRKGDILPDTALPLYENLIEKYDLLDFIENFGEENAQIFGNFKRLVNDLGDTLSDIYLEILLHNVRNPLRSIIAARNTERVSGRSLYDPSTRFVIQYVKNQGRRLVRALEGGSEVSYLKQFTPTKRVKATTTPLYHERYGLIGILCLNIDVDVVKGLDKRGRMEFFDNYVKNRGYTPRFERRRA
ncbi:MAG TPA: PAS domain-containing protein [Pyrinomonadaceae bacterium]|nr:PAS domain-containing protein [Pyrinomonadaceae bacterium]